MKATDLLDTRALVLGRVRTNQPAAEPLPAIPAFATLAPHELLAAFGAALERMGGRLAEAPDKGSIEHFVRRLFPEARVIASAVPEVAGTRRIDAATPPHSLDDVDVGIVRAAFGVAETGSVALSETEFGANALGFLSQHLVVLLDPQAIVADLHAVYRDHGPFFEQARYAVLMTGPSATADIEGVLVRGAQGIRTLSVVPAAVAVRSIE